MCINFYVLFQVLTNDPIESYVCYRKQETWFVNVIADILPE